MPDSVLHSGFMELLSNVQRIRALCARKLISYCPTSLSHKTSVLLHCFTLDLLMHMHVQGINVFPEVCKVRSRVSFACDLAMAWWSRSQLDQWWQNEDQDDGHTARRSFAPGPKRSTMRPPLPPVPKFVEGRAPEAAAAKVAATKVAQSHMAMDQEEEDDSSDGGKPLASSSAAARPAMKPKAGSPKKKGRKRKHRQDGAQDRRDFRRYNEAHSKMREMEYRLQIQESLTQEAEGEVWSLEDAVRILQTEMHSLGQQQQEFEGKIAALKEFFHKKKATAVKEKEKNAGVVYAKDVTQLKGTIAGLQAKIGVLEAESKKLNVYVDFEKSDHERTRQALKRSWLSTRPEGDRQAFL